MKKVIILGASILQLPAIKEAKEMGLYVIAIDMDSNSIGFKYADEYYVVSTIDIEGVLRIARKIKPDGILTIASDKPMLTVAKVGEELNLKTITVETSIKVTNKARMRECLKDNNIPIPNFKVVTSYEEYLENTKMFGKRFIVKPADSSGSRGIYLVENLSQVKEAFLHSHKFSSTGEVLIEDFMEGPEVSVESITIDGKTSIIAITDKNTTGAPHFVELGHSIPSRLKENMKDKINEVTKQAIKALGITNGPSHTEIKITNEGPKIVEVGARLGGDNITTHLVPLSTGVNMVKVCIELAIGEKPSIDKKLNRGASIKYFMVPSGKIDCIKGVKEAFRVSGVNDITLLKEVGDVVDSLRSSTDRVGFVISQGNNTTESINSCDKAIKKIKIEINESIYYKELKEIKKHKIS